MSTRANRVIGERHLRDSRGVTLVELLVASVFGLLILAAIFSFYRTQLYGVRIQEKRTEVLETARAAMDLMVREIRGAGNWPSTGGTAPTGCARIQAATATQIQIQTDLNEDDDCADTDENISYTYNSTSKVIERIDSSNPIASGVEIPAGSDFLTYYGAGSTTPLTHTITDLTTIKRVSIAIAVEVDDPTPGGKAAGKRLTTTLVSDVFFRNN